MSNTISLVGRLGRDSERKSVGSSTVLEFSVGEKVGYGENENTNWWECKLWGKQAEGALIDHLKKGQQVVIFGEAKLRKYNEKIYAEIRVSNVELVGAKSEKEAVPAQQGYAPKPKPSAPRNDEPLDSDLPF